MSGDADDREKAPGAGRRYGAALPVAVFAALAVLLYLALFWGDPSDIPSALKDKPVPEFALPAIEGADRLPGLETADLKTGVPTLVNVWGSWCAPCRTEHPVLMQLAARADVRLVGINYKDAEANGLKFLAELGDPYAGVAADREGRTGLDWGVYGVPETYVIDGQGQILLRHAGPVTERVIKETLRPALEAARAK